LKRVFRYFNYDTSVTCVFDCCHSGTVGDLKYVHHATDSYEIVNASSKCQANIMMISGCRDDQTSADAYNVRGLRQFSGAMTSCLLLVLKQERTVFEVMLMLRGLLIAKRFTQRPQLTASFLIPDNYCIT
jgi:hypothetical protein